jgi:hypothetical protein
MDAAKYVVTIGYLPFVFEDKETALRFYALASESIPAESVSSYGEPLTPEHLKKVRYVRDAGRISLELKRHSHAEFALDMTATDFREALRPGPVDTASAISGQDEHV